MIHNNERYPTIQQEWLLKAAILDNDEAIKTWDKLRMNINVDQLDRGSFRLLPLLYRNLYNLGINDEMMNKLKTVRRSTWYNNQMLFHLTANILDLFRKNGIETMVIKGAAVAYKYYKDLSLRPINDFDVLVKPDKALYAIELLQDAGWKGRPIAPDIFSKKNLTTLHSWNFNDVLGRGFDLHWHLLPEFLSADADNDFWNMAKPFKVNNISTKIICRTDLLLHACIQATRANKNITPIRYLADIFILIDSAPAKINWNRLLIQATRLNMILPVRETLNYIKFTLRAPIPWKVLANINNANVSKIDKVGYKARSRSRDLLGFFPSYWTLYLYQTLPDKSSSFHGFINFMKLYWGLKYVWQIPLTVIQRGFKHFVEN